MIDFQIKYGKNVVTAYVLIGSVYESILFLIKNIDKDDERN